MVSGLSVDIVASKNNEFLAWIRLGFLVEERLCLIFVDVKLMNCFVVICNSLKFYMFILLVFVLSLNERWLTLSSRKRDSELFKEWKSKLDVDRLINDLRVILSKNRPPTYHLQGEDKEFRDHWHTAECHLKGFVLAGVGPWEVWQTQKAVGQQAQVVWRKVL